MLPELVEKFPGGGTSLDGRVIFYTDAQNLEVANISNFNDGYAGAKFTNRTSLGVAGAHDNFPDTDFPTFRLADAYLMYAEAHLRGEWWNTGNGVGLRQRSAGAGVRRRERQHHGGRAHARLHSGRAGARAVVGRHRRTDLIRFGVFTGRYMWSWKGGTRGGAAVATA